MCYDYIYLPLHNLIPFPLPLNNFLYPISSFVSFMVFVFEPLNIFKIAFIASI